VKALVFILILASLLTVGCKDHRRSYTIDDPDISVDPWTPPYDAYPGSTSDYDDHGGEQPVPEPSTMILVGGGAVILYMRSRKNGKQK